MKNEEFMRYAKYKPTGIAWLPELPEEWEMVKVGYCFDENGSGTTPSSGSTDYYDGSISWVQSGDLHGDEIHETKKTITEKALEDYSLKIFQPPFVCMAMYGASIANVSVIRIPACTNQACCVLAKNRETTDLAYLYRCLSSATVRQTLLLKAQGGTQPNINRGDVLSTRIPLPPLPTQRAIVAFLDEKCGKVDRLVAAKEKEVALLKELKQSVIADAVTRGVRGESGGKTPSLGSGGGRRLVASGSASARRLIPSGIPWLPEVPEGWESCKMKYLFNERSNKGHPEEPPLCSTQAHGVIPQSLYENRVVVVNKEGLGQLKLVKVGDFVISLRSFQGGIEIAHYQGIISAAYTILEPRDNRNSAYFRYLFKSHAFIQLLQTCVTGIREGQNINYPLLSRKFIPVPSLAEQREIVAYIEAKAAKIDAAVAGLKKEIAALKEWKQRLIADVVTGQRKVGKTLSSGKALGFSAAGQTPDFGKTLSLEGA